MNKSPSSNNEFVNPEKKINRLTNQGIISQRPRIRNRVVKEGGGGRTTLIDLATNREKKSGKTKGRKNKVRG
jgi:hypothetical protein